jgi:hypothetical protein
MGIVLGALGGMGSAMQDVGSTMFKDELKKEGEIRESGLALQRAKTLEEFKQTLATAGANHRGRCQARHRHVQHRRPDRMDAGTAIGG